jgi:hypothetical protein
MNVMVRDPIEVLQSLSRLQSLHRSALVPRETMLYSNNVTVHPGLSAVRRILLPYVGKQRISAHKTKNNCKMQHAAQHKQTNQE